MPLIARLALGLVMFPHGAQQARGWFGGYGFSATMGFFTGQMHIPAFFAFLVVMAEFAGSIGLILGLFSRVSAFGIAVNMLVAVLMVDAPNGIFMNWMSTQKGEGFEYHLLALGLALVVIVFGGGKWSIDSVLFGWLERIEKSNSGTAPALPGSQTASDLALVEECTYSDCSNYQVFVLPGYQSYRNAQNSSPMPTVETIELALNHSADS